MVNVFRLKNLSDRQKWHGFVTNSRHKGLHNRRDLQRSQNPTAIGPSKGQNDLRRHQYRVAPDHNIHTQKTWLSICFRCFVGKGAILYFVMYFLVRVSESSECQRWFLDIFWMPSYIFWNVHVEWCLKGFLRHFEVTNTWKTHVFYTHSSHQYHWQH